jgi:hypothetical protein
MFITRIWRMLVTRSILRSFDSTPEIVHMVKMW